MLLHRNSITRRIFLRGAAASAALSVAPTLAQNAGDCLHGGFVAYTKANKARVLGVDRNLLDAQGAVSAEVAVQMARGALEGSPADIAVSVTGVLGPDPDEDGNPAGLAYFAVCREGHETVVSRQDFSQLEPDDVRRAAVLHALELLLRSAKVPG